LPLESNAMPYGVIRPVLAPVMVAAGVSLMFPVVLSVGKTMTMPALSAT